MVRASSKDQPNCDMGKTHPTMVSVQPDGQSRSNEQGQLALLIRYIEIVIRLEKM